MNAAPGPERNSSSPIPPARWRPGRPGPLLFAAVTFAAAFLIFLVQPVVGKRILPWFGGAPAVWTLCLAFYQSTLFAGYVYAHLLIRFARPTAQLALHAAAIVAALCLLPVLPDDAWKPQGAADPRAAILTTLAANVALPFLVLASTGPLLQAWFARSYPLRSPYPLYALSNLGSLLALLAYPFLLEPRLTLTDTDALWSTAFAATAVGLLGCAALARSTRFVTGDRCATDEAVTPSRHEGRGRPDFVHGALWMLLAGCAVVLLMGVTNKLVLDVASIPFLWVLPLSIYLLTFILCFSSQRLYHRAACVLVTGIALLLEAVRAPLLSWLAERAELGLQPVYVQIAVFCVLLFGVCMILHGELYRLRPEPRALTAFYLCVSAGGALGGLFVGIGAPVLFDGYREFEIGIALAGLLLLAACARDPATVLGAASPRRRRAALVLAGLLPIAYFSWGGSQSPEQLIHQERSFFGVLRVLETREGERGQRQLMNGSTLHGVQFLAQRARRLPTSYYGRATGLGLAMASRPAGTADRFGVIGLGIGTLSAYGREHGLVRFYEIDPAVVRIARDEELFSYLAESPARIEIVVGDGRLSIAEEQARGDLQAFDWLVLDAFSSDAIPIHLLTVEAFAHYARALAPDGLIAVHVSNRHFDLMPLVGRLGLEVGLESMQVHNLRIPRLQSQGSKWVFLGRDSRRLQDLVELMSRRQRGMGVEAAEIEITRTRLADIQHIPVWTDDYSDLFSLLKSGIR